MQVAAALKQEIAIVSESHTAARGENSTVAAACAMVSCTAISFIVAAIFASFPSTPSVEEPKDDRADGGAVHGRRDPGAGDAE